MGLVKTKITNDYIVNSDGYKRYLASIVNNKKVKGSGAGCDREVFSLLKYEKALDTDNYNSITSRDLAYLFKLIFEGYYGNKRSHFNNYSPIDVQTLVEALNIPKKYFVGVMTAMLQDYEDLGYNTEGYEYLDFRCIGRTWMMEKIYRGEKWSKKGNKKYSNKTADGLNKQDIADLEKIQQDNSDLMELSDESF